jgi:type II secretory pathway pseudopilin PulG
MTSSRQTHRNAFTLTEILVTLGIIIVLASLLLPATIRAFRGADRARLQQQMASITTGLEAYKSDFGNVPTTAYNVAAIEADDAVNLAGVRGARLLCKALLGPGGVEEQQGNLPANPNPNYDVDLDDPHLDGHDGFGFKTPGRSGSGAGVGPVRGPYLNVNAFRIRRSDASGGVLEFVNDDERTWFADESVIVDAAGRPILYYPKFNPGAVIRRNGTDAVVSRFANAMPSSTTGVQPMYITDDNSAWLTDEKFRRMIGDLNSNGILDPGESAVTTDPYLLWIAGPDNLFGPVARVGPSPTASEYQTCDDVTSFQR